MTDIEQIIRGCEASEIELCQDLSRNPQYAVSEAMDLYQKISDVVVSRIFDLEEIKEYQKLNVFIQLIAMKKPTKVILHLNDSDRIKKLPNRKIKKLIRAYFKALHKGITEGDKLCQELLEDALNTLQNIENIDLDKEQIKAFKPELVEFLTLKKLSNG